jgi:membrane protease YdiL (CAAX protease family)
MTHNPITVIVVAVFVVAMWVSRLVSQIVLEADRTEAARDADKQAYEEMGYLAGGSVALGLIAAGVFMYMYPKEKRGRASYWAIVALLVFGLSGVMYAAVQPQLVQTSFVPSDEQEEEARLNTTISTSVSAGAALLAGVWAYMYMRTEESA